MAERFYVRAEWDAEAGVFISETNIPGLHVEADTLADFLSVAEELAPAMLAANVPLEQRSSGSADGAPRVSGLELEIAA